MGAAVQKKSRLGLGQSALHFRERLMHPFGWGQPTLQRTLPKKQVQAGSRDAGDTNTKPQVCLNIMTGSDQALHPTAPLRLGFDVDLR
jgi:hypothetical protein